MEGDFSWADISGSSPICGVAIGLSHPCGTTLNALGTFRERLGFAAGADGNWLLYATGGLAYGRVKSSTAIVQGSDIGGVPVNTAGGAFADTRAGYAVGGGGEWKPAQKWSTKAEYLYYDLGSAHYGTGRMFVDEGPTFLPSFGVAGIATTTHVRFNGNLARLGVNYHLNRALRDAFIPPPRARQRTCAPEREVGRVDRSEAKVGVGRLNYTALSTATPTRLIARWRSR